MPRVYRLTTTRPLPDGRVRLAVEQLVGADIKFDWRTVAQTRKTYTPAGARSMLGRAKVKSALQYAALDLDGWPKGGTVVDGELLMDGKLPAAATVPPKQLDTSTPAPLLRLHGQSGPHGGQPAKHPGATSGRRHPVAWLPLPELTPDS